MVRVVLGQLDHQILEDRSTHISFVKITLYWGFIVRFIVFSLRDN